MFIYFEMKWKRKKRVQCSGGQLWVKIQDVSGTICAILDKLCNDSVFLLRPLYGSEDVGPSLWKPCCVESGREHMCNNS